MKNKSKKKTKQNYTKRVTKGTTSSISNFGSLSNITKKSYVYKGRKNQTEFPEFVKLCKYTQEELKDKLPYELISNGYTDVIIGDGYIYAKGDLPVLLTAHMDTVHANTVQDFYEYINEKKEYVLSSPQGIGGDDRCGIYMILEIIRQSESKPYILFCEDEETGGIGSKKFCKTESISELEELKYMIELDRANGNDAVFYECDNPEFTEFIEENTGYKEAWGSFSDISILAPAAGVAAVNLSCGYYNAHTLGEEVNINEMFNTINVVLKLLTVECEKFEYVEAAYGYKYGYEYSYGGYNSKYYDRYSDYFDDEDYDYVNIYVTYTNKEGKTDYDKAWASTKHEAWFKFFQNNPTVCMNDVIDFEFDYM